MKRRPRRGTLLLLGLLASMGLTLSAPSAAAVTVQAGETTLPAGSARLRESTTYVSLRAFCEAMGADSVTWKNGRAEVSANGWTLTAVPGQKYLTVNGRVFYVPGGVELSAEGRTMVPVRTVAAAYGADVFWQPGEVTVTRGTGSAASGESVYDEDELYWLSRIISAESKGESLEGQIAVGNVVLNRVKSPAFPDSIYGVIFDSRYAVQFEPVSNGTVYDAPTPQSVIAAKLVLEGASTAGECLYFYAPALSAGTWIKQNRVYSHTIGCHRFYL